MDNICTINVKKTIIWGVIAPLLFISLLLSGCSGTKKGSPIDLTVVIESKGIQPLSQLIKSIEFIPLETNENSLFGDIWSRVDRLNGHLYISNYPTDIKYFDSKGNYISKIGRMGKAEDEFVMLIDFACNNKDNTIATLSLGKFSSFSLDGEFQHAYTVESNIQVMTISDGMMIVMNPLTDVYTNALSIYNIERDDIKHVQDIVPNENPLSIAWWYKITSNSTGVFFKQETDNVLYRLNVKDNFRITKIADLDFGDYGYEAEHFSMNEASEWENRYRVESFYANEKYIAFNLNKGLIEPETESHIYSFSDKKFYSLIEDGVPMRIVKMEGDELLCLIEPFSILDRANKLNNKRLKELSNTLDDSSNPVLAIINLK